MENEKSELVILISDLKAKLEISLNTVKTKELNWEEEKKFLENELKIAE